MTEIRLLQPEDAPLAAALEEKSFSMPWLQRDISVSLSGPDAFWLAAWEDGRFAGYAGILYGPDGGELVTIAVEPALRGRSIGYQLVTAAGEKLQKLGRQWLTLEVRPSNQAAIALYTRVGFIQVGRRPRFYEKPREDALLLTWTFAEAKHENIGN